MPSDVVLRLLTGEPAELAFLIETPALREHLTATVTVFQLAPDGTETRLHSDRFVLDRHAARVKFAAAAGISPDDLIHVRERVIAHLNAAPAIPDTNDQPLDQDVMQAGLDLLEDPQLLTRFGEAVQQVGYAGDVARPTQLYLVVCTRGLERPTNVKIDGPSSAGKSHLVNCVTRFFPPTAYLEIAGSSPRALVYSDETLEHRYLIVGEADGMHQEGIGASLIRGLVWGNKLRYETVEATSEGVKPRTLEKAGPTGLITTGTRDLEPELTTRMLSIPIPDDPDTTRQVLLSTGEQAMGITGPEIDLAPWHAAQTWLDQDGSWTVTVPFAKRLAGHYPVHLVRARRDFVQLLELVKASAVLHQRQRGRDDQGRIVADERDYATVYHLAGSTFGVINAGGVTPAVRKVVVAIRDLVSGTNGEPVSQVQVAERVGLDKSVVSRHIRAAIKAGHVVNEEARRGHPMKLRPGDPLPEARPALPEPALLFAKDSKGDAEDPPEPTATLQHLSEIPRHDADSESCSDRCNGDADLEAVQPLTLWDEPLATPCNGDATPSATPDFGVVPGETGRVLQSCSDFGGTHEKEYPDRWDTWSRDVCETSLQTNSCEHAGSVDHVASEQDEADVYAGEYEEMLI